MSGSLRRFVKWRMTTLLKGKKREEREEYPKDEGELLREGNCRCEGELLREGN